MSILHQRIMDQAGGMGHPAPAESPATPTEMPDSEYRYDGMNLIYWTGDVNSAPESRMDHATWGRPRPAGRP